MEVSRTTGRFKREIWNSSGVCRVGKSWLLFHLGLLFARMYVMYVFPFFCLIYFLNLYVWWTIIFIIHPLENLSDIISKYLMILLEKIE